MVKRMSATLEETRKLAPAAAGRWFAPLNKSNDEPPLHVRFAFSDFSISAFSISDFPHWLHRSDTCDVRAITQAGNANGKIPAAEENFP
jgi:hypothetical protein